jgi:hypothetical protein
MKVTPLNHYLSDLSIKNSSDFRWLSSDYPISANIQPVFASAKAILLNEIFGVPLFCNLQFDPRRLSSVQSGFAGSPAVSELKNFT